MKKLLALLLVIIVTSCGVVRIVPSGFNNDEDVYYYEHGHYYDYYNYIPYMDGYNNVYYRHPVFPKPANKNYKESHRPNSPKSPVIKPEDNYKPVYRYPDKNRPRYNTPPVNYKKNEINRTNRRR